MHNSKMQTCPIIVSKSTKGNSHYSAQIDLRKAILHVWPHQFGFLEQSYPSKPRQKGFLNEQLRTYSHMLESQGQPLGSLGTTKSQGPGSGERSFAQPECVGLNESCHRAGVKTCVAV